MSKTPLVSILIPCYNHENFLDDCLTSILAQTYHNIELLICDDCSPDNSFEKIKEYEARLQDRFPRVVILENDENLGVTKNINRMLKIAQGDYIKTLASDDALAPEAIGEMVDFLNQNADFDVVVANGIKVGEEQHYPNFQAVEPIYSSAPNFNSQGFFERVAHCNEISAPAAMVRMSVYEKYGFYDEQVKVEDFEYWLRILKDRSVKFGFLDKKLVFYRVNENSMSSMTQNKNLEKRRRLMFYSEIESLYKYKDYFDKRAFAEIVLERIISARWLAVEMKFYSFNDELEQIWKNFAFWKSLSLKKAIYFKYMFFKSSLKKHIRK